MIAFALKIVDMVPGAIYAGALVMLATLFGFQSCAYDRAKDNLATARANVRQCVAVNESNEQEINDAIEVNRLCIAGRRADESAQAKAVSAWIVERQLLEVVANEERLREIEVYRDPSCAELAKLDINGICPALADSLRGRTGNIN